MPVMPSLPSCSTSLLAPCLVRVNTSTCDHLLVLIRCASSGCLRSRSTGWIFCAITSTVELRRATSIIAGEFSRPSASALISSEKVAENSRFWRFVGSTASIFADIADEAHVEHAVGFVQHQDFDLREIDGALLHVVEQAARRGDQNVDALLQQLDLRIDADAAEDHGRSQLQIFAVGAHAFLDLGRQFAGRGQDQGADRRLRDAGWRRRGWSTGDAGSAA